MGISRKKGINNRTLPVIIALSLFLSQCFSFQAFGETKVSVPEDSPAPYVEGEAIVCLQPEEASEMRILSSTKGLFDAEPKADSEFLMDVSDGVNALSKEEKGSASIAAAGLNTSKKTILKLVRSDSLSTEELIRLYSGKKGVLFAEPNYIHKAETVPVQTEVLPAADHEPEILLATPTQSGQIDYREDQYAFGNGEGGIDVPKWGVSSNKNAEGVVVAVLDTGVDYENEDLKDVMWDEGLEHPELTALGGGKYGINSGYEYYEGDNPTPKSDPMDIYGHGSHCAGIIAAAWNDYGVSGAANGARIMAIKQSINDYGNSSDATVMMGYNYILTAKRAGVNVAVVNCSFGGYDVNSTVQFFCMKTFGENGITVCFASGNANADHDVVGEETVLLQNIPSVINVDSSDREGKKSSFSDYGLRTTHIYAPGSEIISTIVRAKASPVTDKNVSKPVSVSGKELYDDFSSAEPKAFIYEANGGNGTKIRRENGELIISGTDVKQPPDEVTKETFAEGEEDKFVLFTLKLNEKKLDPHPKNSKYHLIFNRRGDGSGLLFLQVYVKTKEGKWERPNLTPNMEHELSYDQYPLDRSLNGNEFDLEDLQIRFVLNNSDGCDFEEAALGEMWITDCGGFPYDYNSGTSMAAPAVVGEVAILAGSFPEDSAAKRAARVLAGAKANNNLAGTCITGGQANVRNALDENRYTPVINSLFVQDDGLHIEGYFFGDKESTGVSIRQGDRDWSTADGTLDIISVKKDPEDKDHREILLKVPEGMDNREAKVTVSDSKKETGRRDYTRILTPLDPELLLPENENLYKRINIDNEALKDVQLYNTTVLNGTIFFLGVDLINDCYATLAYKNKKIEKMERPLTGWGNIAEYDGKLLYFEYLNPGDLIVEDPEGEADVIEFVPDKPEKPDPGVPEWVYEVPDKNDYRIDLYYDGKDIYLLRLHYEPEPDTDGKQAYSALYTLDPLTGRGTYK
ncbi:MAG: S8 family serine peptidase, partial [Lachnospiraceae bacterium]|nr:S8 family serine peptidase [Lachnospiraceae bacterium]